MKRLLTLTMMLLTINSVIAQSDKISYQDGDLFYKVKKADLFLRNQKTFEWEFAKPDSNIKAVIVREKSNEFIIAYKDNTWKSRDIDRIANRKGNDMRVDFGGTQVSIKFKDKNDIEIHYCGYAEDEKMTEILIKIFATTTTIATIQTKKSPDELDTSPKKYVTTKTSFEETNPSMPYGKETANFTFSDKYVTVTIYGVKKVYKVVSQTVNQWGTTVYTTTDANGNYCEWKNGITNLGDPFVQYEGNDGTKITYSNDFR
jgi:hypothetical protein